MVKKVSHELREQALERAARSRSCSPSRVMR